LKKREYDANDFESIKCTYCKKRYNLRDVAHTADVNNYRNLYCPNCGKKVGELN
jgi:DNA-directed RNA polymerase subunit RPC12/RpoP